MYEIPIKTICRACNGEAYVPTDEKFVFGDRTHKRLKKCEACWMCAKRKFCFYNCTRIAPESI